MSTAPLTAGRRGALLTILRVCHLWLKFLSEPQLGFEEGLVPTRVSEDMPQGQ